MAVFLSCREPVVRGSSFLSLQRTTVKRMCIKSLPPVLVIQLKRFGYDWEAGRALKFDDHFEVWKDNGDTDTDE